MEAFREVQYFSWWVYVVLLGVVILLARAYQTSGSYLPVGIMVLIIIIIIAALSLRLETVVKDKELTMCFGWLPVFEKRIPLAEVLQAEASSYRPVRQFGGWGWRFGRGGVQAFTAKGSSGVFLSLRDGKHYLVGSSRSGALAEALQRCAPAS